MTNEKEIITENEVDGDREISTSDEKLDAIGETKSSVSNVIDGLDEQLIMGIWFEIDKAPNWVQKITNKPVFDIHDESIPGGYRSVRAESGDVFYKILTYLNSGSKKKVIQMREDRVRESHSRWAEAKEKALRNMYQGGAPGLGKRS